MTTKHWVLIVLAIALGSFSVYLNKDRFGREDFQIVHRSRPARSGPSASQETEPIFFAFSRTLQLTSLKVITVADIKTNKYPQPLWHLVSDSNSVPIADFAYGAPIDGMRPGVAGATPDPLKPGVKYRLLLQAGKIKAEHDFMPVPR